MYNNFDKVLKTFQTGGNKPGDVILTTASIGSTGNPNDKLANIRKQEERQLAIKAGKQAVMKKTKDGDKKVWKKPKKTKLKKYK